MASEPARSDSWLFIILPIAVGIAVLAWPTNTACEATAFGFATVLLLAIARLFVRRLPARPRRIAYAVAALVVLFVSGILARSSQQIFMDAFGMLPPSAVSNLLVRSKFSGGPGDRTTWMTFAVDRATLQTIVAKHPMDAADEKLQIESPKSTPWSNLQKVFHSEDIKQFPVTKSPDISTLGVLEAPRLYEWHGAATSGMVLSVQLYWDGQNAWVLFCEG